MKFSTTTDLATAKARRANMIKRGRMVSPIITRKGVDGRNVYVIQFKA